MTTEEKIEDIRARLAQASEGPWYVGRCDQGDATCPVMRDGRVVAEVSTWTARGFIDATFIAEARQDIPFLLAQLDAAKAQQAAHRQCHDSVCNADPKHPRGVAGVGCSCRYRDTLPAELATLRAREAKLRAVLRQCKCIGVRDYATCDQRREPVSRMCPRCAALAEGEDRLCTSCQCRHPKDVMCPPHEMRYSAEDK